MLGRALVLALAIQAMVGHPVDEEKPFDYSKHKLIRILPQQSSQLERLEELRQEFDMKVDYWNPPMSDLRPVLSLISPEGTEFLTALNRSNIHYQMVSNNFQERVDQEMEENQRNRMRSTKAFDYDTVYHSYQEIVAEFKALPNSYSNAKYSSVGTTYEGREIPALTISSGSGRKTVILECGIHAREWVSTASCLWMANQLLTVTASSSYLSRFDFVIVPTLNSDGYVFTWTNTRLWRKTRSFYQNCYGADPNRNWDAAFCAEGASNSPCSDTYCGRSAFSESETKAMSNLILSKAANTALYVAIHSYSQLWMYPYGYSTSKRPANEAQLRTLTNAAIAAIKATNGLTFTGGPIATTIYVASGSSIDWAYDSAGVKVAFAPELRDLGQYGFQLPASQIKAACTETWNGIKAMLDLL